MSTCPSNANRRLLRRTPARDNLSRRRLVFWMRDRETASGISVHSPRRWIGFPTAALVIDITVKREEYQGVARYEEAFTICVRSGDGAAGGRREGRYRSRRCPARGFRNAAVSDEARAFDRQGVSLDDVIDFTPE